MTRLFKTVCAHQNIISFKQIKYINVIVVGEKCNDEHWSNGYFYVFRLCLHIVCVLPSPSLSAPIVFKAGKMTGDQRLLLVCVLSVVALTGSDPAPPGPVLKLELSPDQMQTLRLSPSTFYYLCQMDPVTGGVHSSSLARNEGLELVPFERLKDGVSDCRSLGAQHSDESATVQYSLADTGRRQERGLTTDTRQGEKDVRSVKQSGEEKADREGGRTEAGQGWSGLATEVILQTIFNLGIVMLTGAARAGWLGECGQRLVARLMEGRPIPAHTGPALPSPAQTPAAHPGPSRDTEDREDVELREICVERSDRSAPPPVMVGNGLPV